MARRVSRVVGVRLVAVYRVGVRLVFDFTLGVSANSSGRASVVSLGQNKKYLEPMRTPWQGAEGICWLACAAVTPAASAFDDAPSSERIIPGGFYLDRSPRCKHIAGPFMSEGSATRNSEVEVDNFIANLRHAAENRAEIPPPSGKSP